MTDTNKTPDEPGIPDAQEQVEDEDPINFSDRVIAFLILILPFSWSVDKLQEVLQDKVSQYVSNMGVLVGLIGFLVLVGWLSKRVHSYRKTA
jgi:flagellar biogenesis protein FliO